MTTSMTAFAHLEKRNQHGSFSWEIKTTNQRYLEIHYQLPPQIKYMALTFEKKIKSALSRGKIELTLTIYTQNQMPNLIVNQAVITQLKNAMHSLNNMIPHLQNVSYLDILKWPGVLEKENHSSSPFYSSVLEAFDELLIRVQDERKKEGEKLNVLIKEKMRLIEKNIAVLKTYLPQVIQSQEEKIKKLSHQWLDKHCATVQQELINLLHKSDITEELDRLKIHVQEAQKILQEKGPQGRRLDFLMQELHREANTVASKSVHSIMTHHAIDIKVLIEQAREQIQNIE